MTGEPFEPSPIFAGAYTYCGIPFKNNSNIRLPRAKHSSLFVRRISDAPMTNKLGCLSNICWRLYFQFLSRILKIIVYQGTSTLAYLSIALLIAPRQISKVVCPIFVGAYAYGEVPFKKITNIRLARAKHTSLFVHSICDATKTNKLGCLSNICRRLHFQ